MNKRLLAGCFLVLAAVAVFFVLHGGSGPDVRKRASETPPKEPLTAREIEGSRRPDAGTGRAGIRGKDVRLSVAVAGKDRELKPGESGLDTGGMARSAGKEDSQESFPRVATDTKKVVAMVNGQPVTMGDVIAPGVLQAGDSLPESTYRNFLKQAVDQSLLVGKAEELGIADSDDMAAIADSMRKDIEEMGLSSSDEEKEWEVNKFTKMAVIDELYRREGLVPKKVSRAEVNEYYDSHGDEYGWLREREAARGTSPDEIEKKVRRQIERDLEVPRIKEIREKREAYIQALHEDADIQMVKQNGMP
ncbi:MAG: hypothetical protein GXP57_04745 [Deltaproteobacteria bacterium]|nr:hypothetical protein [Deltaproteobacteria bacterium]